MQIWSAIIFIFFLRSITHHSNKNITPITFCGHPVGEYIIIIIIIIIIISTNNLLGE
jgi:hypothetical protein